MSPPNIRKRVRYFIGVEGESEQSLIKWIQDLSDQNGLHIHLECHVLSGGGYSAMLDVATRYRKRGLNNGPYKNCFLLVDSDRAETGDLSIEQLRAQSAGQGIELCCQNPNIEGLLCRMFPGRERINLDAQGSKRQLQTLWPEYRKPADARTLARKYTLEDLLRAASADNQLAALLKEIGLLE